MTSEDSGDGGVENGALLMRFADAVLNGDDAALTAAREEIAKTMGGEALTDTAAVAALFNAIDRVADSTGIEMEVEKAEATADFRANIGVNNFYSFDQKGAEA
jgi:hypothetical protein